MTFGLALIVASLACGPHPRAGVAGGLHGSPSNPSPAAARLQRRPGGQCSSFGPAARAAGSIHIQCPAIRCRGHRSCPRARGQWCRESGVSAGVRVAGNAGRGRIIPGPYIFHRQRVARICSARRFDVRIPFGFEYEFRAAPSCLATSERDMPVGQWTGSLRKRGALRGCCRKVQLRGLRAILAFYVP